MMCSDGLKINVASKEAKIIREVDVLIVGGGPAGIGAAVAAAYNGSKVLLFEKAASWVEISQKVMLKVVITF